MKFYYFVDHPSRYTGNSGVQRVVRGLARSLLQEDCELIFVAWCPQQKALIPVDRAMLNNLAKFQGPALTDNQAGKYPVNVSSAIPLHEGEFAPLKPGWLLVPEIPYITFQ